MQKITTFLTFESAAEDAMNFYVSLFPNAKILSQKRMGANGPFFSGSFEIEGQQFHVMNGGPHFQFASGTSLFISCKDQEEVDRLWNQLTSDGGQEQPCGWLKDKFGVSWQVIPEQLGKLLWNPDPAKAKRVMDAMLKMKKIQISDLEKAALD